VRIVSLLPAATEILFELGLGKELAGVTDACAFPPEARLLPVVARTIEDPRGPDASRPRLVLDDVAFAAAKPDLVIAGGAAGPESVAYRDASEAIDRLGLGAEVIRLDPTSVEGVLNAIQAVGAMTETEDEAMDVAVGLRERLHALERIVLVRREHGFVSPRVVVLEGLEPPIAVGRWVPEQVRLAGGRPPRPGTPCARWSPRSSSSPRAAWTCIRPGRPGTGCRVPRAGRRSRPSGPGGCSRSTARPAWTTQARG
jgi:iron complex transport system substrate-binding protein